MQEDAAIRGGVGAAAGLALGLAQYWIARTLVERNLDAAEADEPFPDRRRREEKLAAIKRLLFASTVVVFPVVGYVVGRAFGAS
jgi:hypothetical protein